MEFQAQNAIWLQIASQMAVRIISGDWKEGERIPSVRDLAADMQVNPNTAMRSFLHLQENGIITNQRGIGYFVAPDGRSRALQFQKDRFLKEQLPPFFQTMQELGISMDELNQLFMLFKNK